jgi:hypothetical protein
MQKHISLVVLQKHNKQKDKGRSLQAWHTDHKIDYAATDSPNHRPSPASFLCKAPPS